MKPIIMKRNNKKGLTFRIIVKYTDEYGNLVSKETSYQPDVNLTEAKAEVYAELFADKFQDEILANVEEKKKQIELDKKIGGPLARMTFRELAEEWLNSKFDKNDPTNENNISYKYYKKAKVMIDAFNNEFGEMHVKDINRDVIYKYYKTNEQITTAKI